jgi:hypothetical protein
MWNPTNATAGVWFWYPTGTYARGLPTTTTVYTSVTRSRYSNVVNTANQILGARNTELMYTRGSIALQGVSFMPGQEWMTNGGLCWNAHSNYSSISDPSALNNTVGFALMQVMEQLVLTRGTAATKRLLG